MRWFDVAAAAAATDYRLRNTLLLCLSPAALGKVQVQGRSFDPRDHVFSVITLMSESKSAVTLFTFCELTADVIGVWLLPCDNTSL